MTNAFILRNLTVDHDGSAVYRLSLDDLPSDRAASLVEAMRNGEAFDSKELPSKIECGRVGSIEAQPAFVAQGMMAVSGAVADVLGDFDLGDGLLWPLSAVDLSGGPVDERWYGLHVGSHKSTWLPSESTAVEVDFGRQWIDTLALRTGKGEVVLSPKAMEGSDIWREKEAGSTLIFISERLGQALDAAQLAGPLGLLPCRILDVN